MGEAPQKIVVLRAGALGDCLVSLPSLKLLRETFPLASITVLGSPYSGPVFQSSSSVDRLLMLYHHRHNIGYMRQLLQLRRERPDLVVDIQDAGRSRYQTAIIGGKRRLGYRTRPTVARAIYTDTVPLNKSVHVTRRISNLLAPLGITPEADILQSELELDRRDKENAERVLQASAIGPRFAILQVTTGDRPHYRVWPPDRFARVAEHLHRSGFDVVIASANDKHIVREIVALSNCPIHHLTEPIEILTLGGIIARCDLYVGYNTGPMHVAAALGRKIVALFDVPSDYVEWFPATSVPCRILRAREHSEFPGWRLDTVETEEVIQAIDSLASESVFDVVRV